MSDVEVSKHRYDGVPGQLHERMEEERAWNERERAERGGVGFEVIDMFGDAFGTVGDGLSAAAGDLFSGLFGDDEPAAAPAPAAPSIDPDESRRRKECERQVQDDQARQMLAQQQAVRDAQSRYDQAMKTYQQEQRQFQNHGGDPPMRPRREDYGPQ